MMLCKIRSNFAQYTVNRYALVVTSLVLLAFLVLIGWLSLPAPFLNVALTFGALIVVPGLLSALTLGHGKQAEPLHLVGIGLALGLAENLILGRLLLTFGFATDWLVGLVILGLLAKVVILWRRKWEQPTWQLDPEPLLLSVGLLLVVVLLLATMIAIHLTFSDHATLSTWADKWSYLTVIEQFRVSPSTLHLRPNVVLLGTNMRLSWSSWLYVTAALGAQSDLHPVALIARNFRPILMLCAALSIYTLGYELFRRRWVALLAAACRLLLVDRHFFFFRLEEDKVFVFIVLVVLAQVFLYRSLVFRRWQDVFSLGALSVSVAMLHPVGLPGLLLISLPVILVEWNYRHKTNFTWQWALLAGTAMVVFLIVPVLDYYLVSQTPYVQTVLETEGQLPESNFPLLATERDIITESPINTLLTFLLIPMVFFIRKEAATRFLLMVATTLLAILALPVVPHILYSFITRHGVFRIIWLIPGVFVLVIAWGVLKVRNWLESHIRPSRVKVGSLLLLGIVLFTLFRVTHWHRTMQKFANNIGLEHIGHPISDGLWEAFEATKDIIGEARAVTHPDYGLFAPVLWPWADLIIFSSPDGAPEAWPAKLTEAWEAMLTLYDATDPDTAFDIIAQFDIEYLLVSDDRPLFSVLDTAEQATAVYQNEAVSVFHIRVP